MYLIKYKYKSLNNYSNINTYFTSSMVILTIQSVQIPNCPAYGIYLT